MMEDEDGYMVLNFRPKRGGLGDPSPEGKKALSQILRWHKISLWIGWVNIILVVTVIMLGVWVSQLISERGENGIDSQQDCCSRTNTSTGEGGSRLDAFRSQLREILCLQNQSGGAEGSRCKLCPANWLQNRSKCYWVTRELKTWHASRDDCSTKKSQLVMIQDREGMEYIKGITPGSSSVWIGLSASSSSGKEWIWLNGSQFDQTW
uniref:C-type lectin domain-containing protein n=1 Tax=Sphenodon punctatus TaxID=8508 RepID=A0A8D0GZ06_SPHPU